MRHHSVFAATSVVLALGVAACGSSKRSNSATTAASSTSPPPAVSIPSTVATTLDPSFIARANAICARAKAAIDAHGRFPYPSFDPLHPNPQLLPTIGAFFAANQPITERTLGELRGLGSPRRAQSQWTQLLALAKQDRVIADRQIVAAKAANVPAFVATVNAAHTSGPQLGKLGLTIGFTASSPCGAIL